MTQEEKQTLFKDLCARLPYKTILHIEVLDENHAMTVGGSQDDEIDMVWITIVQYGNPYHIVKPYLRTMSSMTDEEKKEFQACHCIYELHPDFQPMMCNLANELNMFDWLLSHHFDFRGLIEKGLALEAPKDMYKTE